MTARRAAVLVTSTRAASGERPDSTGPVIVEWLRGRGFEADDATVVADGPDVGPALAALLARAPASGLRLLVTTGGTGIGHGDGTAAATAAVLEMELPGFGEELRRRGAAHTPLALLSRGTAGVVGRVLVVNLPGSAGGVRDGLQLLGELVDHALDQLDGGDHG